MSSSSIVPIGTRLHALWLTARPKTLSASLVPVIVAHTLVWAEGFQPLLWISLCAVLSSIFIQIGTNFVNDGLDFLKGADSETRLGEARATQQGWFTFKQIMLFAAGFFLLAVIFGLPLVLRGGQPILIVGLLSIAMGYAYTGGPYPLAYVGLGDLFVVLFFGLVAVCGTFFLHTGVISFSSVVAGLQVGFLATVLIAINNLRDLEQDRLVHKKTLAVRLGPKLGRYEVLALIALAYLLNIFWLSYGFYQAFLLPFLVLPVGILLIQGCVYMTLAVFLDNAKFRLNDR